MLRKVFFFKKVPTSPTTISVAVGGGSFFVSFVPVTDSAPTMSAVGFNVSRADAAMHVDAGFSDSLPLLADDKYLSMRIFLDNVVAECYWQGGRAPFFF